MKVPVTHGVRSRGNGELATWAVVGFSAGLAAGFVLGELLGTPGAGLSRLVRDFRRGRSRGTLGSPLLERVREALRADLALAGLTLEVTWSGPNRLELRGWVNTRRQRAHAYRRCLETAGLPVLNRILVRGEDDRHLPATPDESPRSA